VGIRVTGQPDKGIFNELNTGGANGTETAPGIPGEARAARFGEIRSPKAEVTKIKKLNIQANPQQHLLWES
jgi:hypothetical protein